MNVNKSRVLNNVQFYQGTHPKTLIFWHHTAGMTADGAISWWNQTPERVGTAYVIDRDGTIFECYDPKGWGYHLGVKGDDDHIEKQSIGIEIVAAGGLQKEGDQFAFYPLWPNKLKRTVIPTNEVWDMGEEGWKGQRYFHAYTEKQIDSLIDLSNQLIVDFKIKVDPNWKNSKFYEFNEKVIKTNIGGIFSHTTVRKDKNDIVPFPYFLKRVYEGIKVPIEKGTESIIPNTQIKKK